MYLLIGWRKQFLVIGSDPSVCVRLLDKTQRAARNHQIGSRNPRPPDPLALWRRYSAYVASARFSSETDFYSFAVLMTSQNEASIWVSSPPIAARKTPSWLSALSGLRSWQAGISNSEPRALRRAGHDSVKARSGRWACCRFCGFAVRWICGWAGCCRWVQLAVNAGHVDLTDRLSRE